MDLSWHPPRKHNESIQQSRRATLRPRKMPRPEYEMAIFLENLDELPVPILDSQPEIQSPSLLLEEVLSVCTEESSLSIERWHSKNVPIGQDSPALKDSEDEPTWAAQEIDSHPTPGDAQYAEEIGPSCETLSTSDEVATNKPNDRDIGGSPTCDQSEVESARMSALLKKINKQNRRAKKRKLRRESRAMGRGTTNQNGINQLDINSERIRSALSRIRRQNKRARARREKRQKYLIAQ